MTSFTWSAATGGDWSTAIDWNTGTAPDSSAATVTIASASTTYVVQIGTALSEIVNTITIGSLSGTTGPTLAVDGTLQFAGTSSGSAFLRGGMVIGSTGLLDGSGDLGTATISGVPFALQNFGTVDADAGAGSALAILAGFTNSGTLLATDGDLLIEGSSFANISGATLTGGSYIASGPASGTDNEIEFGANFTADIVTDAANIVLDGAASDIQGFVGGHFQSLEQQLQTIAAAGTLQLLGNRGYTTSNLLTDNGMLTIQGGTLNSGGLTIGAGGTLAGSGVIGSGIGNQGAVIATGGAAQALLIEGALTGTGSLVVSAGSTMILDGGTVTAATIAVGGTLFDKGSLDVTGATTGTGTIVVEGGGGALDLAGSGVADINFAGTGVAVTLASPGLYEGTLTGFGPGDALVLDGIQGNAATVVAGNTLAVMSGGTTLDSIVLAGNYAGASFTATTIGSNTVVQNTAGAPVRDDMPIDVVNVVNTASVNATVENEILADLTAAAANWGQYITGAVPLRVSLTIGGSGAFGNELALGSPGALLPTGETVGGDPLYEPDSTVALVGGSYAAGTTSDVAITLFASAANLASFDFNTNQAAAVPAGEYDLVSILMHEFAHGLGLIGVVDTLNPTIASPPVAAGSAISTYDQFITTTIVSGATIAFFTGANAETAYGALLGTNTPTPVPLTLLAGDQENFYHFANAAGDPLGKDLMSGIGLGTGTAVAISTVDLAVLQDIGVPVTANVVCYVRGTRFATPDGAVTIEDLRAGDFVLTARGAPAPVVWIGRRHIDCRRHPQPWQVQPVRIQAHAFGPGQPNRDLLVSPRHGIFFAGVLMPARLLLNGSTVTQLDLDAVDYWHIELPRHDLLLAEGLAAESYLDTGDRHLFDNGGPVVALHPDFASRVWEGAACAELKLVGPEIESVQRHLRTRAAILERTIATTEATLLRLWSR